MLTKPQKTEQLGQVDSLLAEVVRIIMERYAGDVQARSQPGASLLPSHAPVGPVPSPGVPAREYLADIRDTKEQTQAREPNIEQELVGAAMSAR